MKKTTSNVTELVFVLDRSGSMESLTSETIGGFNSLIEKQKKDDEGDEVYVTTVLFDDQYEILHDHISISEVYSAIEEANAEYQAAAREDGEEEEDLAMQAALEVESLLDLLPRRRRREIQW